MLFYKKCPWQCRRSKCCRKGLHRPQTQPHSETLVFAFWRRDMQMIKHNKVIDTRTHTHIQYSINETSINTRKEHSYTMCKQIHKRVENHRHGSSSYDAFASRVHAHTHARTRQWQNYMYNRILILTLFSRSRPISLCSRLQWVIHMWQDSSVTCSAIGQ